KMENEVNQEFRDINKNNLDVSLFELEKVMDNDDAEIIESKEIRNIEEEEEEDNDNEADGKDNNKNNNSPGINEKILMEKGLINTSSIMKTANTTMVAISTHPDSLVTMTIVGKEEQEKEEE